MDLNKSIIINPVYVDDFGNSLFDIDESDPGHLYQIKSVFNSDSEEGTVLIKFQSGLPVNNGINGITNEILLAILIDRLNKLDKNYPDIRNKYAISCLQHSLDVLRERYCENSDKKKNRNRKNKCKEK